MSGTTQAIESSATALVEGFESIPHRLKLLGEHIAEGIAHPFAPPVVKETLPLLLGILQTMSQEIAELRVPCPCKPAAASVSGALEAAGVDSATGGTFTMAPASTGATVSMLRIGGHEVGEQDFTDFVAWQAQRQALATTSTAIGGA